MFYSRRAFGNLDCWQNFVRLQPSHSGIQHARNWRESIEAENNSSLSSLIGSHYLKGANHVRANHVEPGTEPDGSPRADD
jgi:hypothetical protein